MSTNVISAQQLIYKLQHMGPAMRSNRQHLANMVLVNPHLFYDLLVIAFDTENKLSIKAAWILELVCEEKINWLLPHLDFFTNQIKYLKYDSAIRPISKIYKFIALAYNDKSDIAFKKHLTKIHIDLLIETGFDWMISDQKVAVKAYTMESLFEFGISVRWVHPELKSIIQQHFIHESPGYKACGRKIIEKINQRELL